MTGTGIHPDHDKQTAPARRRTATAASKVAAAAALAALGLAAAALAVSLTHAGPRGAAGPAGSPGPVGQQGPAGADGQDAPTLGYQCQMLMPKNGGTETTFYWPCTPNGG